MAGDADSRFEVELEAGPVWQTSNDVQIPNDAIGTRFSLADLVGQRAVARRPLLFHLEHQPSGMACACCWRR